MKKFLKILFSLIGIVIVLIIIAAIAVPMFFDPNDYKDQIATQVKEQTGRELKIDGDIKLSVFPWLGLDLGAVEVGNAPGFAEPIFARSDEMQVRVKLLPLLKKQLEMDTVSVQGLTLNLAKNAEGVTNWDDLVKAGEAEEKKPEDESGGPPLAALAIGGVDIRDAHLSWDDAQAGQQYAVNNLAVKTGPLDLAKPIDLSVAFDVQANEPKLDGHITVDGQVLADLDATRYQASGLEVTADVTGGPVPGGKTKITLNLDAVFDGAGQTFEVSDLRLNVPTLAMVGAAADLALQAKATGDLANQTYAVSGFSLKGNLDGETLPLKKLTFDFGANVNADLNQLKVTVSDLRLDAPEIDLGDVSGNLLATGQVDGDVGAQSYSVKGLSLNGNFAGKAIPGEKVEVSFGTDIDADLGNDTLSVSNLQLSADDLKADGNLTVSALRSDPQLNGALNVGRFNLRELMNRLGLPPIETVDAGVLSVVEFSTKVSGSANRVNLDPLSLTLDDSNLKGTLGLANLKAKMPAVSFDLALDGIDADRYLPPPEEGEPQPAASPGAVGAGAGTLPLDTLRALDIDGSLRVGKVKISNLNMSDILVTVKAKDGKIGLNPVNARLYDGSYAGNIGVDASGAEARVTLNEKLSGVQAGPLLLDLNGDDKLSGQADVALSLDMSGADPEAMKRTMNGQTSFSFTNGAVKGINIGRIIREAQATLAGRSLGPEEGEVKTDFAELSGSYNIVNGVATGDDLTVKSPLLRVLGEGTADLVNEQLDYGVTTTIVATAKGQGGEGLEELKGIPIPIRIKGPFADPSINLDVETLVKAKAGAEIERQKAKAKEKLEEEAAELQQKAQEKIQEKLGEQILDEQTTEKLGEPAKKLLKGLFD